MPAGKTPGALLLLPTLVAVVLIWIAVIAVLNAEIELPARAFSDCTTCPTMIRVPAGSFEQADLQGTGDEDEQPIRTVTFSEPFALSRTEVTYAQWDACVSDRVCDVLPEEDIDPTTRLDRPVQNASWDDAEAFVKWLSARTGKSYRLPTEPEFEYAARAGSQTRFAWGNEPSRQQANYGDENCCGGVADGADQWTNPAPVGSFPANAFGLHDMAGNVQEWVQDCWVDSYEAAALDGSARTNNADCELRGLRGGSWSSTPKMIRPANRDKGLRDARLPYYGFRVARDL